MTKSIDHLREIASFRYVLLNLVMRDLRAKYQQSFLGFLWTLLYPALLLGIWITVFGRVLRFDIQNYWAFLPTEPCRN